jgi:hypothetical protein
MFLRHRHGPIDRLNCPHAMGTNTFSPQWPKSFRHILLLPSPSLVYRRHQPPNLRVSLGAGAAELQTLRLRIRRHAGACPPPLQRTAIGEFPTQAKIGLEWATRHPQFWGCLNPSGESVGQPAVPRTCTAGDQELTAFAAEAPTLAKNVRAGHAQFCGA